MIELVKTPGRKKNVPRRTRAATAAAAKAKDTTSLSLDVGLLSFQKKKDIPLITFLVRRLYKRCPRE